MKIKSASLSQVLTTAHPRNMIILCLEYISKMKIKSDNMSEVLTTAQPFVETEPLYTGWWIQRLPYLFLQNGSRITPSSFDTNVHDSGTWKQRSHNLGGPLYMYYIQSWLDIQSYLMWYRTCIILVVCIPYIDKNLSYVLNNSNIPRYETTVLFLFSLHVYARSGIHMVYKRQGRVRANIRRSVDWSLLKCGMASPV